MDDLTYRLLAYPVTGGEPRVIPARETFISTDGGNGLRLQLARGDCREATWTAVGRDLALPPLTPTQVQVRVNGVWTAVWFGEVRIGGNARDVDGESYTLRGMSRTFDEVILSDGFAQPAQAAHLTLRAAFQDVISSGQWGTPSLVLFDEARFTDLGFDFPEVKDGAQQTLAGLIEAVQATGTREYVDVWVGVRPDRYAFARPAAQTVRIITGEISARPQWRSPVAETPYTAVLWYLGKRGNGRPLTYLSRSESARVYRTRIKRLTPGPDLTYWQAAPGTWTWVTYDGAGRYVPLNPQPPLAAFGVLRDGKAGTEDGGLGMTQDGTRLGLLFETPYPFQRITYTGRAYSGTPGSLGSDVATLVAVPDETGYVVAPLAEHGAGWAAGSITLDAPATRVLFANRASLGDATQTTLILTEFRADLIDPRDLDSAAQYHYAPPAREPAELETQVFVAPDDLPGRVRLDDPDFGPAYERGLDAVEYRITDNLYTAYLTEQADDPGKLAQAALIKKRDDAAVITAVTA